MGVKNLKGRMIEDVAYSGLIESLSTITVICQTVGAAKDDFTKEDLMNLLTQIAEIGTEAMAFSGATREEVNDVSKYLLEGMRVRATGRTDVRLKKGK